MDAPIVDDELWTLIEPFLPSPKPRRKKYPSRLPVANRAALNGILIVLNFSGALVCWNIFRRTDQPY